MNDGETQWDRDVQFFFDSVMKYSSDLKGQSARAWASDYIKLAIELADKAQVARGERTAAQAPHALSLWRHEPSKKSTECAEGGSDDLCAHPKAVIDREALTSQCTRCGRVAPLEGALLHAFKLIKEDAANPNLCRDISGCILPSGHEGPHSGQEGEPE